MLSLTLLLVLAWFVLIWILTVNERPIVGGFLTLFAVLAHDFFAATDLLPQLWQQRQYVLLLLAAWPAIGGVWSLFRWWRLNSQKLAEYQLAMAPFRQQYAADSNHAGGQTPIFDGSFEEWLAVKRKVSFRIPDLTAYKPTARAYTWRIISWIAYWPWSMLWYALSDVLTRVFEHVYNMLQGTYRRITEAVWADVT
jgi:hypothetical protein